MSKGTESHTSRSTEICLEGINAPWGEVLHLAVRSSYPKGHKTLGSFCRASTTSLPGAYA